MGKIKPTRVITPRIIQPGESRRPWWVLVLLPVLALWSWQMFEYGRQAAAPPGAEQRDRLHETLQQRIAELEEQRDDLQANVSRLERAGQIDRTAANEIQTEVKELQEQRAELKREMALLKSLASDRDETLTLGDARLVAVDEGGYRFEVTLSKRTDNQETVSGHVVVGVTGKVDGEDRMLDMQTLTGGSQSRVDMRFKNFQKLKIDLRLPAGFEPASILVSVRLDGKELQSFEQAFDWKLSNG